MLSHKRLKCCRVVALAVAAGALTLSAEGWAQHRHHGEGHGVGGHNHRFDDPQKWAKAFDDPARDEWQKPDAVIKALALEPAHLVADIGAGTGYFAIRLARAVPSGRVFAVDIEPKMAEHIAKRAGAEKLSNISTVVGDAKSPKLAKPVDRVLLINTYHHIDARPGYFRALHSSLKPGARVAIVDYRVDAPRGAPKHMRLPPEKIAAEMAEAGYRLVESFDFLPLQTYQVFSADQP